MRGRPFGRPPSSYNEEKATLSTWIYTITHNVVCNYYRQQSKRELPLDESALCYEADDGVMDEIENEIRKQFGEAPLENKDYGKIINEKHFARLCSLIDEKKVVISGSSNPDTCQIAPTVMDNVTYDDAVMGEEIFGPITPILTFNAFVIAVARRLKME